MNFAEGISLNYGYIICKCNLVDCIYMTEEFINDIKKNNKTEYLLGIYEVGRYAWLLEDITPIEKIESKGKLGIWTYKRLKKIILSLLFFTLKKSLFKEVISIFAND